MAEGKLNCRTNPSMRGQVGYITVTLGTFDMYFRSSDEYRQFLSELVGFYNMVVESENK